MLTRTLGTIGLLVVCRLSGAALIGVGFLTGIGGVDKILLLTRGFGTGLALLGALVALAGLTAVCAPAARRRVAVAALVAFVAGAGVSSAILGLTALHGEDRLAWALVGGGAAGIAVSARVAVAISQRLDPAPSGHLRSPVMSADELDKALRGIVALLAVGTLGLLAAGALIAAGVQAAVPGLVAIAAACVLIPPLVGVAALLALPAGLLLAEPAVVTAGRSRVTRASGLQPLPDALASAIASLMTIGTAPSPAPNPPERSAGLRKVRGRDA